MLPLINRFTRTFARFFLGNFAREFGAWPIKLSSYACLTFEHCILCSKGEIGLFQKIHDKHRIPLRRTTTNFLSFFAGRTKSSAVRSCEYLFDQTSTRSLPPPSGVYWVDPVGGSQSKAFQVYCDMETDGGGWTLVWSYTFTNYDDFTSVTNAVTPRPNWPVHGFDGISTTAPMNETDYNAMSFSLWKQLGRQFLIKSNINNWLVCHPGTGSLVDWQEGDVNCRIVKHVTNTCNDALPPSFLRFDIAKGVTLCSNKNPYSHIYYRFDSSDKSAWPVHDPCGKERDNHVKSVLNPHGNIYIRT